MPDLYKLRVLVKVVLRHRYRCAELQGIDGFLLSFFNSFILIDSMSEINFTLPLKSDCPPPPKEQHEPSKADTTPGDHHVGFFLAGTAVAGSGI